MRIIHSVGDSKKEGEGEGSFLLSDRKGGYLCLPNEDVNNSNYQGWLTFDEDDWGLYKTIENIYIEDRDVTAVHNKFSHVERDSGPVTERFYVDRDAILYEVLNYDGFVSMDFDFRSIHDFDDEGRIYEVYTRGGGILIVKYVKYVDEDLQEVDYEKYLAVKGVRDYWTTGEWKERCYEYDRRRNSRCKFYIYGTLKIKVNKDSKLVFSHGATEEEAIEKANNTWHNEHTFKVEKEERVEKELWADDVGLNAAMNSLNSLIVELDGDGRSRGIFAGFPWFFQFWRRDELISSKALLLDDRHPLLKGVLMHYLDRIGGDGRMENKNVEGDLISADATGWLFLRLHEFLKSLKEEEDVYDHFSEEELYRIKDELDAAIDGIMENHVAEGLVKNGELETWMDTVADGDDRSGARLEIQALHLRMYEFGKFLADLLDERTDLYEEDLNDFREQVRDWFYEDGRLADGVVDGERDMTQRPNVFLAYYIYPGLLSEDEWRSVFDNALEELWLDWGGLASISKEHELFTDEYTGETNESYHRGDSWYWINNVAAICMDDLDGDNYAEKIERIREASVDEMLFSGYLGHCAEVSSAMERRSEGCRCQAWSAATLIELLRNLKG